MAVITFFLKHNIETKDAEQLLILSNHIYIVSIIASKACGLNASR